MSTTTVSSLGERLNLVEKEVAEIRAELARVEAERLPPATELASRIAGRKVSDEELRERGRAFEAEFQSRFGNAR